MPTEIFVIKSIKAVVELGGFFLIGQGLLFFLAGAKREQNFAYQLLKILTGPLTKFTRWITPKWIVDRHIPYATFFLLFWIWVATIFALGNACAGLDIAVCRH
ncbi:MAG: hypothetical protein ABIU95_02950 [Burkholderiales bacterium]